MERFRGSGLLGLFVGVGWRRGAMVFGRVGAVRARRSLSRLGLLVWAGVRSATQGRLGWRLIGAIGDGSAGGLEDDATSDLDGMVGEAFVVAAKQRDVDGGGDAVFPSPVH